MAVATDGRRPREEAATEKGVFLEAVKKTGVASWVLGGYRLGLGVLKLEMSRKTEAGDGDDGGGGGGPSAGLLPVAMADEEEMKRRFGEGGFEFVCFSNEEIGRESRWRFFLS